MDNFEKLKRRELFFKKATTLKEQTLPGKVSEARWQEGNKKLWVSDAAKTATYLEVIPIEGYKPADILTEDNHVKRMETPVWTGRIVDKDHKTSLYEAAEPHDSSLVDATRAAEEFVRSQDPSDNSGYMRRIEAYRDLIDKSNGNELTFDQPNLAERVLDALIEKDERQSTDPIDVIGENSTFTTIINQSEGPKATITVTASGCTVEGAGVYALGAEVTLTATVSFALAKSSWGNLPSDASFSSDNKTVTFAADTSREIVVVAIEDMSTTVITTMRVSPAGSHCIIGPQRTNDLEAIYVNGVACPTIDNFQTLKAGVNEVRLVFKRGQSSYDLSNAFSAVTVSQPGRSARLLKCDLPNFDNKPITSIAFMFDDCQYLEEITGFDSLNLGDITDPAKSTCVFQYCRYGLKHLPFNPTLKVIGVAYSNHNYSVEDNTITIPACVETIVAEHNFYGLGSESYDKSIEHYKVCKFALSDGHHSNLSIGSKGELYCVYNGKKTLISIPQGWDLTDNTFELASDCVALGNLSLSRNYAMQKIVLPDGYETTRCCRGDNYEGDGTGNGIHIAAHKWCSLNSIEVSSSNTRYSSANGLLYSKDGSELICVPYFWPNTNTKEPQPLNIPPTVTKIGADAFTYANGVGPCISQINIPASVTYISPDQCRYLSFDSSKVNIDPANTHYEKVDGKIVFKNNHYLIMTVATPVTLHLDKGTSSINCQYSTDGSSWSDFPTTATEFIAGTYYLKGTNSAFNGASFVQDSTTGAFSLSGNLNSLLDGTGKTPFITAKYAFSHLFYKNGTSGCPAITSLRDLYLPYVDEYDTARYCYDNTFKGCGASELPSLDWPAVWANELNGTFDSLSTSESTVKFGMDAYYYHSDGNLNTTGKTINVYTHGGVKGATLADKLKTFGTEGSIADYPPTKY